MTKPKTKRHIKTIASIGILLLIIGISLWLYTDSVIRGHEQLLDNPNLTPQQKWDYEGSYQWWKTAKKTTYDPLTIILITIGLIAIEYTIIYIIVQPE